jgi:hypothetical protein
VIDVCNIRTHESTNLSIHAVFLTFALVDCVLSLVSIDATTLRVSLPNCFVDRVLTYYRTSRTTNIRILFVITICTVPSLWLAAIQDIIPTPHIVFKNHDQPTSLVNASCESTLPPVKATKLSQTLFPMSNPENAGSWIEENHKTLRALFRCMELSNCEPNQKKGGSPTYFDSAWLVKFTLISRLIGLNSLPRSVLGMG